MTSLKKQTNKPKQPPKKSQLTNTNKLQIRHTLSNTHTHTHTQSIYIYIYFFLMEYPLK